MTHSVDPQNERQDPEGSIFLPKTDFPDREFESWHFQLLTARGIASGMEYDDIQELADQLEEMRMRYIGDRAINAI